MAMLHFFCDESGKSQKNNFVSVSGIGAARERLDPFDAEWRALLRSHGIEELHTSHFLDTKRNYGTKCRAGETIEERQQMLFPFADCINKYLEMGLIQAWSATGYNKLSLEVKKKLGGSHDVLYIAFVRALLEMAKYAGPENFVNVIIDDNIVTAWDTYLHYREGLKADTRGTADKFAGISFAKSIHYMPLQAADLVNFLSRRLANEKFGIAVNDCRLLSDYLFENQKPPNTGIMQWWLGLFGEEEMAKLANDIINGKEKRIPDIRTGNNQEQKNEAL
jgi:Protein of unknown function (DUF3800)